VTLSRRRVLGLLAGAGAALRWPPAARAAPGTPLPIAPGPFQPTRLSLETWTVPDWFRDAKFGIWAHWGPQSAPEAGDWYARQMYQQGHEQYEHHLKTFGHPSKAGFKDVIPTWKAEAFDPAALMKAYKKAGARYFVTMGVHHDNFDLWGSRHQRWNAVRMGPKRDIVRAFREAARAEGLRFGISEHLWVTYKWFSIARDHDDKGPLAGVPYDGGDPGAADLYQTCPEVHRDLKWDESGIADSWKRHWFDRIKDLVDQHRPDLLYSDSWMPFGDVGTALVAHLYNQDARARGGRVEAVYTSKGAADCERGTCVYDVERGMVESIWPRPWSSHTCVGNWHYKRGQRYKSAKIVVDTLVDVVSRNGNLLLNFPLRSNGTLDDDERAILDALGAWMAVNGEAIYGTRPWRTFGEGPSAAPAAGDAKFNEAARKELTAADVRFTTKGDALYAFVMGQPGPEVTIAALAPSGAHGVRRIERVERLGVPGSLRFTQDAKGLTVALPARTPSDLAVALKILGA
jgi:alpha-L-fucosidase